MKDKKFPLDFLYDKDTESVTIFLTDSTIIVDKPTYDKSFNKIKK